MLGSLPKLADKAFVLGFLFPVFLFLVAAFALCSDIKGISDLLQDSDKNTFEKLTYLAILLWGLAILMMMLNQILFQMLEGYLWPLSRVKRLKATQLAEFDLLTRHLEKLAEEWETAGEVYPIEKQDECDSTERRLNETFPNERELVLPTRFGNAIRAFEVYSGKVYGADSIPLWVRLATVVPKEFQAALEDARAQVNCLVNIVFFASLIALLAAIRFVLSPGWSDAISIHPPSLDTGRFLGNKIYFGLTIIGAIAVARISYELAIERVRSWGDLVEAAFDCYLPALARRLGYKLPTTGKAQRDFWTAVSRRAIFHREFNPEEWISVDEMPKADASRSEGKDKAARHDDDQDTTDNDAQKDED